MYIGLSAGGDTQVDRLTRCPALPADIGEAKRETLRDLTWCNPPKKRFLHHQIVRGDEPETWLQDEGSNIPGKTYTAIDYHDNSDASPAVSRRNAAVNDSYRWQWKDRLREELSSSGVEDLRCTEQTGEPSTCTTVIKPVSQPLALTQASPTNRSQILLSKYFQASPMSVTTCGDFHSNTNLSYRPFNFGNVDTEALDSTTCMSDKNAFFDHYLLSSSMLLASGHPNEENHQQNHSPPTESDRQSKINNNSLVGCGQFGESWDFTGQNSADPFSPQSSNLSKVTDHNLFVESRYYDNIETRNHSEGSFHVTKESQECHKTSCNEDSLDQLFFEFNGGYRNNQKGQCKGTNGADFLNMPNAVPSEIMSNHPTPVPDSADTSFQLHLNQNFCESEPVLLDSNYSVDHYDSTCTSLENSPSNVVNISRTDTPSREPQSDSVQDETRNCQVCGEKTAGFHCGAFVCEACKKFFIRSAKKDKKVYKCLKNKECVVTRKLRTLCQYCRYKKCLALGMYKPGEGPGSEAGIRVIPCRVCSAPSSGYHFGAITCEGCKGFFRRMVKERELTRYGCVKGSSCQVTQSTRNICKACRYQKCLQVGMSAEGSRIGRQPNAVKHATQMEMKTRLDTGSVGGHEQQQQHMPLEQCSPNNNTVPFKTSPATIYTISPEDHSSKITSSSASNNHPVSVNAFAKNQRLNKYQNTCTSVMTTNNINTDLTAASTASELDIFYQIVKAGYELEGLNKKSPDLVNLPLEDFKDMNSCWKNLMTQFTTYAHTILNFAKKIPGYRSLKLDDQVSLLRTAMYPIIVLSHSVDYNPDSETYNYFNFNERERDLIFHFIPGFIHLREHFLRMGEMVVSLSLDRREFEYLYALILLSPDEGNVTDKHKVWEVQENIAASLQEYEERNYEDGGTRFGVLIARLAEFRMINLQHQQIVAGVVKTHPSFQIPQLFSELFLNK